jgi:hypothetical protein
MFLYVQIFHHMHTNQPYFISFWAGCDLLICNGSLLRFYLVLTPYGTMPDEHFFSCRMSIYFCLTPSVSHYASLILNYQMFQASHYASLIINYPMSDFLLGTSLYFSYDVSRLLYEQTLCMHCMLIQKEDMTHTWWTERSAISDGVGSKLEPSTIIDQNIMGAQALLPSCYFCCLESTSI